MTEHNPLIDLGGVDGEDLLLEPISLKPAKDIIEKLVGDKLILRPNLGREINEVTQDKTKHARRVAEIEKAIRQLQLQKEAIGAGFEGGRLKEPIEPKQHLGLMKSWLSDGENMEATKAHVKPLRFADRNGSSAAARDDIMENALRTIASSFEHGPLPQRNIPKFDGNVLEFHSFMAEFEENIGRRVKEPRSKLSHLRNHCIGEAFEAIQFCAMIDPPEEGYQRALEVLKEQFGQRHKVVGAYVRLLTRGPKINEGDNRGLNKLWNEMSNCFYLLSAWNCEKELDSSLILTDVFRRLPRAVQNDINNEAIDLNDHGNSLGFQDIMKHVRRAAKRLNSQFGQIMSEKVNQHVTPVRGHITRYNSTTNAKVGIYATTTREAKHNERPIYSDCPDCNRPHPLFRCNRFRKRSIYERYEFVRKRGLCFNCFIPGHTARLCRNPNRCQVTDCGLPHHTLLHFTRIQPVATEESKRTNESARAQLAMENNMVTARATKTSTSSKRMIMRTRMRVVPVQVWSTDKQRQVSTYAFLDGGATRTLCTLELLRKLEPRVLKCKTKITMKTANCIDRQDGYKLDLVVKGACEAEEFSLKDVLTASNLPDVRSSIPTQSDVTRYPHLSDLVFPKVNESEVELLIGSDNEMALEECERRRKSGCPTAVRTRLGWTLNGLETIQEMDEPVKVNFMNSTDQGLHKQLEEKFSFDFSERYKVDSLGMSMEDKQALSIMKSSVTKSTERNSVLRLPWRPWSPRLLCNRTIPEKRIGYLKVKLSKDPKLFERYKRMIEEYMGDGHAGIVSKDSKKPAGKTWYVPHHLKRPAAVTGAGSHE